MKLPLLKRNCHLGRVTILDDSSPPRQVPLWSAWRGEGETARSVHSEIVSRFEQRTIPHETEPLRAEGLILIVGCIATMVLVMMIAWLLNLRSYLVVALILPGWVASMAMARLIFLRRARQELRSFLLARDHCASCGYDLSEVPGGRSNLTVCPECGAVWRLGGEAPALQCVVTPRE